MKKIRIVSPAKQIEKEHVDFAVDFLSKHDFLVELGKHVLGKFNYFSGTTEERKTDFQEALDDKTVDIILCTRGGYGCIQFLDELDFSAFIKNPKLIVGYSDITVFHNHIFTHFGIETLHASVPLNFSTNSTLALASLINAFNEATNRYEIAPHELNKTGFVEAPVVGGNLAILYSLLGTNSDLNYSDKILFVEEIGEAIYAIDRMFYAFKKSGKLDQIAGLVIGGMTNMKDSEIPFGKTVEEVIYDHVKEYDFPICFNFPAGHIEDNRAVFIGKKAQLKISERQVVFCQ